MRPSLFQIGTLWNQSSVVCSVSIQCFQPIKDTVVSVFIQNLTIGINTLLSNTARNLTTLNLEVLSLSLIRFWESDLQLTLDKLKSFKTSLHDQCETFQSRLILLSVFTKENFLKLWTSSSTAAKILTMQEAMQGQGGKMAWYSTISAWKPGNFANFCLCCNVLDYLAIKQWRCFCHLLPLSLAIVC